MELHALTKARLFAGIPHDRVVAELAGTSVTTLEPGDVLLEPSRHNCDIHVLLEGELLVSPDMGDSKPLARLYVGDCVGEVSMIDDQPPSAYVLAASQGAVLSIPQSVLWQMMERLPRLAVNMLQILAERFRQNNVVLLDSLEMQRRYRDLSETDALTRLHNRAWCTDVFPKQLDLCERIGQPVSLAMIDIDHFKQVNDEYGHPEGDAVLRHFGQRLPQNLRSTDLCGRYGGEEFIVLMPATPQANAVLTMERLRRRLAEDRVALSGGRELSFTVSIGVAEWKRGMSVDDLIGWADQALYQAKQGGRNRVVDRRRPG